MSCSDGNRPVGDFLSDVHFSNLVTFLETYVWRTAHAPTPRDCSVLWRELFSYYSKSVMVFKKCHCVLEKDAAVFLMVISIDFFFSSIL